MGEGCPSPEVLWVRDVPLLRSYGVRGALLLRSYG